MITHVVDTRDSTLMLLIGSCDNRHISDKVYRPDPGNIQNHAGETKPPVFTAITHAGEQDYTGKAHQPASYEQIAGANRV